MNHVEVSRDVIDTLSKYDSPTISNVIELFELRPRSSGYLDSSIKATFPEMAPIVGFACTATLRASKPPERGRASVRSQIEGLLKLPSPRIMVFEDLDSPLAAATFGEVMCSVYKRFGCVGLITNGAGRDLDAVRKLGFAIFASAVCVSHGYSHFEELHKPVSMGGTTIYAGDLIHADANGVVVIPPAIAGKVAEACPDYIESEKIILDYLGPGDLDVDGLQNAFDKHSAMLRAITRRYHGKERSLSAGSKDESLL